uniref:E3 ubiquitin protein ligase n=1 Tax=Macrostomum lignano TaxID=282301 RepID=A0A1I8FPT2_9PLAT
INDVTSSTDHDVGSPTIMDLRCTYREDLRHKGGCRFQNKRLTDRLEERAEKPKGKPSRSHLNSWNAGKPKMTNCCAVRAFGMLSCCGKKIVVEDLAGAVLPSPNDCIDDEGLAASPSAPLDVDETLRAELESIHAENARLHQVNTSLQERLHTLSLRALKLEEQPSGRNKHDDSQYNLERSQHKVHRLEKQLAEAVLKSNFNLLYSEALLSLRQMEEELMKLRGRACGSSSATTAAAGSSSASAAPATPSAGSTSATADNKDANKDASLIISSSSRSAQQPSASSSESSAKDEAAAPSQPPPARSRPAAPTQSSFERLQLRHVLVFFNGCAEFENSAKENADRATISASEARLRTELEESRAEAHGLRDGSGSCSLRMTWLGRSGEETLHHCQQKLNTSKQEEDALLKEMEVMELAFSDVQEQNQRLMKQLKEKDDANLKLMNERQKGDKMRLLLQEEKDVLANQLRIIGARIEAQSQVVQKLEEKDRLNMGSISTLEKEVGLRQQALDIFKRRSAEHQQQAQDLQLNLDKYLSQVRELQAAVQEKAAVIEKEGFRHKRLLEELATLKRKHDRLKKIEESSNADESKLREAGQQLRIWEAMAQQLRIWRLAQQLRIWKAGPSNLRIWEAMA